MIRVVYLGKLADAAGRSASEFAAGSGEIDWTGLLALLDDQVVEGLAGTVLDPRTKISLNGEVLPDREALLARNGDEIALLPPVSGG